MAVPGGWIQTIDGRASISPHRRDRSGRYAQTYPPFVLTRSTMKVVARFIAPRISLRDGFGARVWRSGRGTGPNAARTATALDTTSRVI